MNKLMSAVKIVDGELTEVDISIVRTHRPTADLDYVILTISNTEVFLSIDDTKTLAAKLISAIVARTGVESQNASI